MAGKFEVYQDRAAKYRFRLKASNGQVVATGEAYETKSAAKKAANPSNVPPTAQRSRKSSPSQAQLHAEQGLPLLLAAEIS